MKTKLTTINNEYDVYIGRARYKDRNNNTKVTHQCDLNELSRIGYFGNPYSLKPNEPAGSTIPRFKHYFYSRLRLDPVFKANIIRLRGKTLACFCKTKGHCHGSIILNYLNRT